MRVIVSAGGTGGHIYPALAIINKIKEKEPNSTFLYIGTTNRMEATLIPKTDIPFVGIEMKGLNRHNIFANFKVISCFIKGINKSSSLIKSFNPDIVLGIGGYITAPVIYAAKKLGYKTFIHEQNSIPGVSNKFLANYADKIGVSLPNSINYFNKDKVIYTGNPRSEEVLKALPIKKEDYGLSDSKKLVLIVMGSLGSTTMTDKLLTLVPAFKDATYEVLLVTGNDYYKDFANLNVPSNVKVVPYLDNMLGVMKKTDLIVSRAGASTVAEITTLGLPSILVPSPYVTHNHQLKNALELSSKGATCILEEKDFSSTELMPLIDSILNDKVLYNSLRDNAIKLGIPDSATKIYNIIKELVGGK
ncbi:MAG: undecaprenyldiphospho-muramoylpentapeptide beta-N-acetylglucosaminyltransferase [Bacilli bacterium]